ncbi:MAG: glycosyltransferase [Proteobacteria bacterium]|nr:glycosyltransferase [Pseudomonadota bacterium]
MDGSHVRRGDGGALEYRVHRTWHAIDQTPDSLLDAPEGERAVLLFGLGGGEQLLHLLTHSDVRVVAWERDPWILRLLLEAHDLSKAINRGKLWLRLGADLLDEVEHAPDRTVIAHPFFAAHYAAEARLLQDGLGERRALVCDGTLFVDDVADALRAEGFTVGTWEPKRLAKEELDHAASRWEPEFVVSINHVHGLPEACARQELPLAIWEIDPSTDRLRPAQGNVAGTHVFTWRGSLIPAWKTAGFGNVEGLPLAANPERRFPIALEGADVEAYTSPVAFVGASMVDQGQKFRQDLLGLYALWKGGSPMDAQAEGQQRLEAALGAIRADFSVDRTGEAVREHLGDFAAAQAARGRDIVPFVAEMAGADKRLTYIAQIGQVEGTVWGDDGWRFVEQFGVNYKGPAGHRDEINKVYSGATVNLDVGRIYQSDIVTMRVFDVMACGGFVLAEHCPALEALFEAGVHLDWYRDLPEMLDRLAWWLERPDEAREVGQRAAELIRSDHTIRGRIGHILDTMGVKR